MSHKRILAALAIGLATALGASAQSEEVLRVYDARDLRIYSDQGSYLTISPRLITNEGGTTLEMAHNIEMIEAPDVLMQIAGVSGLAASRLQDGIYIVSGEESAHQQLIAALESYRAVNGERYIVEIEAQSVATDSIPLSGDTAPKMNGGPLFRSHQTISARAESIVQAMATDQYISGWVPVVGNNAVGYQVQYSRAENGFAGKVTVGAGEATDGSVSIQLAGIAVKSDISTMMITLSGDELPLNMVRRQERSINSSIVAPIGQRVVLMSVSGFDPGTTIVITATVSPAPRK